MFKLDKILPKKLPVQNTEEEPKIVYQKPAQKQVIAADYKKINKQLWATIPAKSYIKYEDKENNSRSGQVENIQNNTFYLRKFNGKFYNKFQVEFKNVNAVYVRQSQPMKAAPTPVEPQPEPEKPTETEEVLDTLGEKLLFGDKNDLEERMNQLEARLQKIEIDLLKMIRYLKEKV
jgi:hypothetical protein